MGYGRSVLVEAPFDEVVPRVKEALHEQGFGVLTEPDVGLMLPCNVVVRLHEDKTLVSAVDAEIIADLGDHPSLKAVAEEASALLDRALDGVSA